MRKIVAESTARYGELLKAMEEIDALALDRPEEVLGMADRLARLQGEAAALDARIGEGLKGAEPSPDLLPLLRERYDLMVEIERRNRLLSPRIEAMMAAVSAELNDIRTGRSAMAGYRSGPGETGRRFRDAY